MYLNSPSSFSYMQNVIFTDLDGTLLNNKYSFKEALPALKLIRKRGIPLIFYTSKTEPETKIYLKKTKIKDPFIVENGGAVFVPKNYFDLKFDYNRIKGNYFVIELGTSYTILKKLINKIKKEIKCNIIDFSEINEEVIARETGLTLNEAELAKKRRYSFEFKVEYSDIKKIVKAIKKYKLNYTKGRNYYYIMKGNDKAKAVKVLTRLYKRKYRNIFTIGLGNDLNDFPMLKAVDKPFLIKNKKGYDKDLEKIKNIEKINFTASKGWNKAILEFLKNVN